MSRRSESAGLLLFREDGRVLLLRRAPELVDGGAWSIPGGGLEADELPLEAAYREATEEMGSVPEADGIGSFEDTRRGRTFWTFAAIVREEDARRWRPRLNWENTEWGWFDPSELPEPLHPGVDEAIRRILS